MEAKTTLGALKHHIRYMMLTKKQRRHEMVGPARLWKMKRGFQIRFLKAMGLTPEHYLLDVGCGTLRGGIPLISYLNDGHYFGIEVREEALTEGLKELQEERLEGKEPTLLLCPDISQLVINREFDYIWAFSVLIHMSDDILDHTLDFVRKHLKDDGVFFANVNIGETHEGAKWQEFPGVWRTLEVYSHGCSNNGLSFTDIGPLKDYGHVSSVKTQDSQRMLKITKKFVGATS